MVDAALRFALKGATGNANGCGSKPLAQVDFREVELQAEPRTELPKEIATPLLWPKGIARPT